jgi:UDP-N-acetylmuramoyl-tripeptide--D-alanyl-D-alanine ligase
MATPIPQNSAPLTAWAAAAATGGRVTRARPGPIVARGIASDTRSLAPGCAFVALRGERHDGHDFVDAAVRAGAAIVVVERGRTPPDPVDAVEVDDTLMAWQSLAGSHVRDWRRRASGAKVVAITGSSGKTTTKELCAALFRSVGDCHATVGNLNNRVGVPAIAFGLRPEHRFAVFEVGMSVRGEIASLAGVLEPDIAVITNVGVAHADGVGGTRGDVAREKGDLFAGLSERSVAVACFDDAAAMGQLARTRAHRVVTFGRSHGSDYRLAERVSLGLSGSRLRVHRRHDGVELGVRLSILGEAAALDFLASLAAVEAAVGPLDDEAIAGALDRHLRPPPGRMQPRALCSGTTVLDDTYNANPESVRAALRTLADVAVDRRSVVVLGEMRELGPIAFEEHDDLAAAVAQSGARVIVSCGGLADRTARGAARAGVMALCASDAEEAAGMATNVVVAGDVVLVKASRSVGAERVVDALVRAGGGEIPAGRGAL